MLRAGTLAELDARGGIVPVAAGRREAVVVRARDGGVFAVARPHDHRLASARSHGHDAPSRVELGERPRPKH